VETSALDFKVNAISVVEFSFANAGTSQTSTRQAEIVLCHAVRRLSLVCFPPFFWLEELSVFGATKL